LTSVATVPAPTRSDVLFPAAGAVAGLGAAAKAGSAPATVRSTTHPGASGKALRRNLTAPEYAFLGDTKVKIG